MTSIVNLTARKGDSEDYTGTVTDAAGVAVDIQAARLTYAVTKYPTDTVNIIFKDSDEGPPDEIQILDDGTPALRGKYRIKIYPPDTEPLVAGFYSGTLRVIYVPDVVAKSVTQGTFRLVETQHG